MGRDAGQTDNKHIAHIIQSQCYESTIIQDKEGGEVSPSFPGVLRLREKIPILHKEKTSLINWYLCKNLHKGKDHAMLTSGGRASSQRRQWVQMPWGGRSMLGVFTEEQGGHCGWSRVCQGKMEGKIRDEQKARSHRNLWVILRIMRASERLADA